MNNRIKEVRKELKMTQTDFAKALNLSKNFISLIELGNSMPSDRTIKDICDYANINEEWLRTGNGEMRSTENIDFGRICAEIGTKDKRAKKLLEDYYYLSDEDKELFWNFMDRFIQK